MANFEDVENAIDENAAVFDSRETIAVRARPTMVRGRPDWNRCYIEVVARRPPELSLPDQVGGIPVIKVAATLEEQAARVLGIANKPATEEELATEWRTGLLAGVIEAPQDYSRLTYTPLDPSKLREIDRECELVLHVSPDDSWPVLNDFLTPAQRYSVGMYDFTAPHIIESFAAAGEGADEIGLCLGRHESLGPGKKANDWPEEKLLDHLTDRLGGKLKFAWASTGLRRQFASAYHIKVAVKDREEFWLSSGNWQSSNQPDRGFAGENDGPAGDGAAMGGYNREWHIVVRQPDLAGIFEDYISKDLESSALDDGHGEAPVLPLGAAPLAEIPPDDLQLEFRIQLDPAMAGDEAPRAHRKSFARKTLARKKRRIMPLLTPDNYAEHATALLRKAEHRLWFQNQSLSVNANATPAYRELLDVLREKAWEIDDCRIIFRDIRRPKTIDALRLLDRDGFPMNKVRVMGNCHTKGILVDSRLTLIGSHNWTNEGTNYNRDASLIIEDEEVAAYFEGIVDHDWTHLCYRVDYDLETPVAVLPLPGEPIPGIPESIDPRLSAVDDG